MNYVSQWYFKIELFYNLQFDYLDYSKFWTSYNTQKDVEICKQPLKLIRVWIKLVKVFRSRLKVLENRLE